MHPNMHIWNIWHILVHIWAGGKNCQKFMKKLKIVFLPFATNSAEIVERVHGIMAAIPTSLIIESCVFLLVSCAISELAKK